MNFVYNPLEGKFDMIRAIAIVDGTTQGQMSFWDATLGKWTYTETSELFWDDTNKTFGIGTARGISCFLSDSNGNLLGEFKSGILIGDENKFLITQGGEQLLTQSNEELIYN